MLAPCAPYQEAFDSWGRSPKFCTDLQSGQAQCCYSAQNLIQNDVTCIGFKMIKLILAKNPLAIGFCCCCFGLVICSRFVCGVLWQFFSLTETRGFMQVFLYLLLYVIISQGSINSSACVAKSNILSHGLGNACGVQLLDSSGFPVLTQVNGKHASPLCI